MGFHRYENVQLHVLESIFKNQIWKTTEVHEIEKTLKLNETCDASNYYIKRELKW